MNKLTKSELIEKLEDLPERGTVINVDTLQDVYIEAVKHCVSLINNTEIIPDPVPAVDTELEEAKKLVGTWVKLSRKDVAFCVERVENCATGVKLYGNGWTVRVAEVEPFPLPTAAPKWRCMKTDAPVNCNDMLLNLGDSYHVGWYVPSIERWSVRRIYIDLSCYNTALWLEIPRAE